MSKDILIFCEGKDEENFFQAFIENLRFPLSRCLIKSIVGKDSYKEKFVTFMQSAEADNIKSVLLTRDSDGDYASCEQSLSDCLKQEFDVNLQGSQSVIKDNNWYGIHIFCEPMIGCMLEDACIQSLSSSQKGVLANAFIDNAHRVIPPTEFPKNISKARCRAIMSLSHEDAPSLGVAALQGYWDFNSAVFSTLSTKLKSAFNLTN